MTERNVRGPEASKAIFTSRTERVLAHFPRVLALADRLVPEGVKTDIARRIRRHENRPQAEPFRREVNGISALFGIRTPSDYRVVARENYERDLGEQLIGTINP